VSGVEHGTGVTDVERYRPLKRLLSLALWLQGRRYVSLREVVEEFGVHKRTARRYLVALEEAGWKVPVWRTNRE
jgi:predicted DNA-binding transcriptional regulator YafY